MNEAILSQILANQPRVTHITDGQNAILEKLYHASLIVDPTFGEIEVDDNASIADIYKLLGNFFDEKELGLELKSDNNILQPKYSYTTETLGFFVNLAPLLEIKERDRTTYYILLHCISLVSQYCFNSIHHHDWWKEQCEEYILNLEDDEREHYSAALALIDDYNELKNDIYRISKRKNISILKNIKNNRNNPIYTNLSPKIKSIIYSIINEYKTWKLTCISEDEEDPYDGTVNFTEYCGFKLIDGCDSYNQLIDDELSYYYNNCFIRESFYFNGKEINNINPIKVAINSLYIIIEAIGQTIEEI